MAVGPSLVEINLTSFRSQGSFANFPEL